MKTLDNLKPALIWSYFLEITRIPRPSGKTQAMQNWLLDFAKKHKLEHDRDAVGNVIIRKAATKGMEHIDSVVLQSHMDMVCEKNSDVQHDFEKDPIDVYIDGDWLKASILTPLLKTELYAKKNCRSESQVTFVLSSLSANSRNFLLQEYSVSRRENAHLS